MMTPEDIAKARALCEALSGAAGELQAFIAERAPRTERGAMTAIDIAADLIRRHEGLRLTVYDDKTGKPIKPGMTVQGHPTIGWGRCLDLNGITEEEADDFLRYDLGRATGYAVDFVGILAFNELAEPRQAVLIDMAHNLGGAGLHRFKRLRASILEGSYERAAAEMLESKWAHQVGSRADRLAEIMRTGEMAETLVA